MYIDVIVRSIGRGVGKTTLAMTIVKDLRALGYDTVYEGSNHDSSRLIEEQIKRTIDDDPYIIANVTITVMDHN